MSLNKINISIINIKQNNQKRGPPTRIKVYNELITNIIKIRNERGNYSTKGLIYRTNRVLKPISIYFLLKSVTTSGVIKDYTHQFGWLLDFLGISKPTFYSYLKQLESLQLVKRNKGALILSSYSQMCETFELSEVSNISYILYQEGVGQEFYKLLEGSIISNKNKYVKQQVNTKIERIKEFAQYLRETGGHHSNKNDSLADQLLNRQIADFKNNSQTEEIEYINPDYQISARKIREIFGFKSNRSVAYLKKKLIKANIAQVYIRKFISPGRARKTSYIDKYGNIKRPYVGYLDECKATFWRLPDMFVFSPEIYM